MAWNKLSTYKTNVTRIGSHIIVKYHDTNIVSTYDECGRRVVELNTGGESGGWSSSPSTVGSATTKRKMNQAARQFDLGFTVHQHRHKWFVTTNAGVYAYEDNVFVFDAATGLPWGIVAIFAEPSEATV